MIVLAICSENNYTLVFVQVKLENSSLLYIIIDRESDGDQDINKQDTN